ncbi:heterokaryon incompatibility protein-domain-containing protein, partial [Lophiotrema nucula]
MYTAINTSAEEIRVLTLAAGKADDDIHCTLQTTPLSTARYEALSYVWGYSRSTRLIHVQEKETQVTENLEAALRDLRYDDQPRLLWVDALCINQSDGEEKGHQVRMMGNIYSGAERVICWLQPHQE